MLTKGMRTIGIILMMSMLSMIGSFAATVVDGVSHFGTVTDKLVIEAELATVNNSQIVVKAGLGEPSKKDISMPYMGPAIAPAAGTQGDLEFSFTAANAGKHEIWMFSKPSTATKSIWIAINGAKAVLASAGSVINEYQWSKVATFTAQGNENIKVSIQPRNGYLLVDKFMVTAGAFDPETGTVAASTPAPSPTATPSPTPTPVRSTSPTPAPTPVDPNAITVLFNGAPMIFDVPPQLINDRTMVPMRAIFEKLGAVVTWDDSTQTAKAVKGDKTVELTINNKIAKVDGQDVALDVPAQLINNRTLVPLRFVSENLDADVQWVDETKTVVIKTAGAFQPNWSQDIIDKAIAEPLMNLALEIGGSQYDYGNRLDTTAAALTLSVMAYYNRNTKSTGGTLAGDRLVAHVKNMIKGGNEPSCAAHLTGWIDGPGILTVAMLKSMPDLWSQLTEDEVKRCDFIMKATSVAGNYIANAKNNPKRNVPQLRDFGKGYNPNLIDGYIAVMIANYIYFGGADAVNANLAQFKYDDYIAQMDAFGFTVMKKTFEAAGKSLLENGGKDAGGGAIAGVTMPFTYLEVISGKVTDKEIPYEPMALFASLARRQFFHPFESTVLHKEIAGSELSGKPAGYIEDGSVSPFDGNGQAAMLYEFKTSDAGGTRSSGAYVVTGALRIIVPIRAVIEALGYWTGSEAEVAAKAMHLGMEDFLFKAARGYHGYSKDRDLGVQSEMKTWLDSGLGYEYQKELWLKAQRSGPSGKGSLPAATEITVDGKPISGFDPNQVTLSVPAATVPVVAAKADAKYTIEVIQATDTNSAARIFVTNASDPTDFIVYHVFFK